MENIEFQAWPKLPRLNRAITISEKIDGTNAAIGVTSSGEIFAQSRTRIITPDNDNAGFAKWVHGNKDQLVEQLGEGLHFGEWWGQGIGRKYNLTEKRFSLFNTSRWRIIGDDPTIMSDDPEGFKCVECPICFVVPVLNKCDRFDTTLISEELADLKRHGSFASPGFMNPEGIVVFHAAAGVMYKVTYEHDEKGKDFGA